MPLDRSRRRDLASYLRIEEPELEAGGLCRIPARDSDVRVSVRRRTAAPTRPMQREAFGWEHPGPMAAATERVRAYPHHNRALRRSRRKRKAEGDDRRARPSPARTGDDNSLGVRVEDFDAVESAGNSPKTRRRPCGGSSGISRRHAEAPRRRGDHGESGEAGNARSLKRSRARERPVDRFARNSCSEASLAMELS